MLMIIAAALFAVGIWQYAADTRLAGGRAGNDALCLRMAVPQTVMSGQQFSAIVSMQNTGSGSWRGHYYLIAQEPPYNTRWGLSRAGLPVAAVAPDVTVNIGIAAIAPEAPGTYAFYWQMAEGETLFGEVCRVAITVLPYTAPALPPVALTPLPAPQPSQTPGQTPAISPAKIRSLLPALAPVPATATSSFFWRLTSSVWLWLGLLALAIGGFYAWDSSRNSH